VSGVGPIGRLGAWTATHFRWVLGAWVVIAVGFGVFAPRVEHALSGAGWEASGSESVKARGVIDAEFGGLSGAALQAVVHSDSLTFDDAGVPGRCQRRCEPSRNA
jgi:RND superfamily putative drug exporter